MSTVRVGGVEAALSQRGAHSLYSPCYPRRSFPAVSFSFWDPVLELSYLSVAFFRLILILDVCISVLWY